MKRLELDGLSKSYGRSPVLSGIYLSAEPGEIIGILGRNGSGKTTLFRSLLGCFSDTHEVVKIDGTYRGKHVRWRFVGLLPQESFLPRDLTAAAAVRLFVPEPHRASLYGDDRIRGLLREKCGNLSGGERRYLEVLLVASLRRPVLVLDEPFSELEPKYIELLCARIRDAASEGVSVFVTDHNQRAVRQVCTRLLVLHAGSLYDTENTDSALRSLGYLPDRSP